MSTGTAANHSKLLSVGSGLFLIVLSLAVVVFAWTNSVAVGIAWFAFLIGIALLTIGPSATRRNARKTPFNTAR